MKEKLILKSTGKPINLGDMVKTEFHYTKDGATYHGVREETLTEKNLKKYINKKVITVQTFGEPNPYEGIPDDISYYLSKVASNLCTDIRVAPFFGHLFERLLIYSPTAIMQMVLKEIALTLDCRFHDYITQSQEIWGISLLNGAVYSIPKEEIKNYRNFAAFRSKEDALFAKKVASRLIKMCFKSGK